jgi:Uma2 family endonuclease
MSSTAEPVQPGSNPETVKSAGLVPIRNETSSAGANQANTAAASPLTLVPQFVIPANWRASDLLERLGNIPAGRIRLSPPPGFATADDVLRIEAEEGVLCELEDGILVEKPMGWYESSLAILIAFKIGVYLESHDIGKVLGADGSLKILPGTVKIPDVSFISWSRFPREKVPRRPIPALVPDLAVEVLSDTNTKPEMDAKLEKYFEAGVRLVWYIDPPSRSATAFTGVQQPVAIPAEGFLDGGDVLPGFSLSLAWLFEQADRQAP